MSIHRRAAKRDSNEKPIIEALQHMGASVHQLSANGVPDLLIGINGTTVLAEVKAPKGKLTDAQVEWHGKWEGGHIYTLRSVQDAIDLWCQVMESEVAE